ncbi:carbohydrate ABC transporter permease [Cohnella silvisoli]|uniref:Sugar ABC transporter permease n=1 Tax=Cohnella silvisoli TaxID=2873699 RepID=A0ABV1KRE4_9BACL|nr:sugar ABC transporter permease [Cohnella silvisoli]MCD9024497.1 sugar ABC transporter permease [Cohnella silvisoli]
MRVQLTFNRARRDTLTGYLFILPGILGFLIFVAYPLLSSVYFSMTKWSGFDKPTYIGLKNFEYMFHTDPTFWSSIRLTITYAIVSVPLGLVFGLLLAMLLNKKLPAIRFFRTLFYLPVVIPVVATATLWMYMYQPQYGLANNILRLFGIEGVDWLSGDKMALLSLTLIYLWGVGSNMIIFLSGLQSVPADVYEAADIDGASGWLKFSRITLPLLTPILFLQLITGLITAFQTFVQPSILAGDPASPNMSLNLLNLSIYSNAFRGYEFGYAIAQVWILFFIILIFTIIAFGLSKRFVYYENEMK